jgi:hypothetical protein
MAKIIKFTEQQLRICEEFASAVDTTLYASRNQFNPEKRALDSKIGKLGEFAVYESLKNKIANLTQPDCKIYKPREKSWDYDLKGDNANIHVKCQSVEQGEKYGVSWIFQNEDKHIFKNYNDNDYVAFVSLDLNKQEAHIRGIYLISFLHEKALFKKPKLAKLFNKSAVYFDDLKDVKSELAAK